MKLLTRKLGVADFSSCWPLYPPHSRFNGREVCQIERAWAQLLPRGSIRGSVIYDADSPSQTVRAFGVSCFLRESWVEAFKQSPKPYQFVRNLVDFESENSPILREEEIALDNAREGLYLATVLHGMPLGVSDGLMEVGSKLVVAYQDTHRGFHLKETIAEVYGIDELRFCTQGGSWSELSRYESYYWSSDKPLPNENEQPILMNSTRASCALASPLWCMFDFSPPVLQLSNRQKRVLTLAVDGMTDRGISEALNLRIESVQNCFRGAWAKLAQQPRFNHSMQAPHHSSPGKWRRAHLLRILSEHMEELRPWKVERPRARQLESMVA